MIIVKKVKFKNLFSVGNSFVEFELNTIDNLLVVGKSGEGKSTIIDAITFALFGRAYRSINKKQLVNSINKKGLLVEIEFNDYKVVRGILPEKFEIYKNDILIEQKADTRDYQNYLEKDILKMNYKTFTQVVILGSAAFTPFMKLTPANRRIVVEELLDLHIFSAMADSIKRKIDDSKSNIRDIKINLDAKKSSQDVLQSVVKSFSVNNDSNKIDTAKNSIELVKQKIEHLNQNLQAINFSNDDLKKYANIDTTLKVNSNNLLKENKFLLENDDCPTCNQKIEDEFKNNIINKNKVKLQDLEIKKIKCSQKISKISKTLDVKEKIENKIQEYKNLIVKYQSIIDNFDNNSSKQINITNKKLDILHAEIKKLEKDLVLEQKLNTNIGVCQLLLKDSGIKTVVIERYIPLLNKLVNKYLEMFDMFVKFEFDNEFNEKIKSRHRDTFTYNSFSIGEQKRLDFSILLAFREIAKMRNSVACNLLVVDELLDGLDVDNVDNLERIIGDFKDTNTIFISHSEDLKNRNVFSKVIKTQKDGNFTTYNEIFG